ncbi:MAG: periplasmic heavy metal sensor [Deltaproteobacteria bacterium]
MTRKKALVAAAAVTLVVAAAIGAWALGTGHATYFGDSFHAPMKRLIAGKIGRFLVFRSEFELRDDQKKKIFDIIKAHKQEIIPLADTMLEKRTKLREAILRRPTDEQAVREAATSLSASLVDASILAAKLVAQARSVLTEDQWRCILNYRKGEDKAVHTWLEHLRM